MMEAFTPSDYGSDIDGGDGSDAEEDAMSTAASGVAAGSAAPDSSPRSAQAPPPDERTFMLEALCIKRWRLKRVLAHVTAVSTAFDFSLRLLWLNTAHRLYAAVGAAGWAGALPSTPAGWTDYWHWASNAVSCRGAEGGTLPRTVECAACGRARENKLSGPAFESAVPDAAARTAVLGSIAALRGRVQPTTSGEGPPAADTGSASVQAASGPAALFPTGGAAAVSSRWWAYTPFLLAVQQEEVRRPFALIPGKAAPLHMHGTLTRARLSRLVNGLRVGDKEWRAALEKQGCLVADVKTLTIVSADPGVRAVLTAVSSGPKAAAWAPRPRIWAQRLERARLVANDALLRAALAVDAVVTRVTGLSASATAAVEAAADAAAGIAPAVVPLQAPRGRTGSALGDTAGVRTPEQVTEHASISVADPEAVRVASRAWLAARTQALYGDLWGAEGTRGLRTARLHAVLQRGRFAAQVARELTGGRLRRVVDGAVVAVAIGDAATRGGALHLTRRLRHLCWTVDVPERNTSAACDGCHTRLALVFPTPASPPQVPRGTRVCGRRRGVRGRTGRPSGVQRGWWDRSAPVRYARRRAACRAEAENAATARAAAHPRPHAGPVFRADRKAVVWCVKVCVEPTCAEGW
ncbi:hypothetical protein I4F81_012934 [Pyropia yezoensis]|uniref:Uncharacterized protein n=1 Tax=Pyropia yezoensis TaxID=2788 RepID=A0ABQ9T858_PYRYE|nr:hypothetical protein I4F81_012934 [Neopyropia yezoensis]